MRTMTLFLIGILCALIALPALAAPTPRGGGDGRGGDGPRGGEPRGAVMQKLRGHVVEVNASQRTVRIALYVRVRDAKAPGVVPKEMEKQAAVLRAMAAEHEKRGNAELARKMRAVAEESQYWRQIEQTLTDEDRLSLMGLRQVPVANIPNGTRVRVVVRADGDPTGAVPARVTLDREDIMQTFPQARTFVRPRGRDKNVAFYEIVGDVVSARPLVLQVEGQRVAVEVPPTISFRQLIPVTAADMKPDQRLHATVQMRGEAELGRVSGLIILLSPFADPALPETILEG